MKMNFFGRIIGVLIFLSLVCGCLSQSNQSISNSEFFSNLISGVVSIFSIYFVIVFLHKILPGTKTVGYCCDADFKPLEYKLNGLLTLIISIGLFFMLPLKFQTFLYSNHFYSLIGANIVGFSLSLYLYLRGGDEIYNRCPTIDQISLDRSKIAKASKEKLSIPERFYIGFEWNPRWFDIDSKMMLYVIGAVGLALNILSFCSYYYQTYGRVSNALLVYTFLSLWFLHEYMFFENVHLYTYDLFAEKLGFKLTWGCCVFYPFFYCIGVYSLDTTSLDLNSMQSTFIVVLFFVGWIMTRGSNLQKYYFKVFPEKKRVFFGLIEQKSLHNTKILVSGFWSIARHLNYFGEIVQSIALSIPGFIVGESLFWKIIPFGYPFYYFCLFVKRQLDDDELCLKKYGETWNEYCRMVRWRIFPGIW
jgi:protein-S-isoprenylcysteine O-methyltransferase Ste14